MVQGQSHVTARQNGPFQEDGSDRRSTLVQYRQISLTLASTDSIAVPNPMEMGMSNAQTDSPSVRDCSRQQYHDTLLGTGLLSGLVALPQERPCIACSTVRLCESPTAVVRKHRRTQTVALSYHAEVALLKGPMYTKVTSPSSTRTVQRPD